jgi:predicted cupin superfamily sugar epimerase
MSGPYPYPTPNSVLIDSHKLEKHFEGGYFAQTVLLASAPSTSSAQHLPTSAALDGRVQIPSGAGTELLPTPHRSTELKDTQGKTDAMDATLIYYLLTPDTYRGRMHMNLHSVRCLVCRTY